ncbi:hypothetical protein DFH07DRAFT_846335 [Mycena maculata]|uniref:Uncharacterized protein n=1 Tax=Mycena maculata TaxID=230809 RepID=A0AAD7I0X9_9AGAR|nr:hypothetical protein DFH07DRAFT_846335 [Mycena maculata]
MHGPSKQRATSASSSASRPRAVLAFWILILLITSWSWIQHSAPPCSIALLPTTTERDASAAYSYSIHCSRRRARKP